MENFKIKENSKQGQFHANNETVEAASTWGV